MSTRHTVQAGETISQIAQRFGFQDWRFVWDALENGELRARRGEPRNIRPGDEVFIPPRTPRTEKVMSGARGAFQLTAPPPLDVFEVGFFDKAAPSEPIPALKVTLRLPGSPELKKFTTSQAGIIRLEGAEVGTGEVEVSDILDERADPHISYQHLAGQTLRTGESHVVELPDKRKVADKVAAALRIQRRAAWGAAKPTKTLEPDWDYDTIVIHHSGDSGEKVVKALQTKQMAKGYDDIAYEYVVQLDGSIAEGRHLAFKSAANSGQNAQKLAILVAGDFEHGVFDFDDDDPTPAALDAVVRLVEELKRHFPLKKLVGHRDLPRAAGTTECPGGELYKLLPGLRARTGLAGP